MYRFMKVSKEQQQGKTNGQIGECDLANTNSIGKAIHKIPHDVSDIDALVNCAGAVEALDLDLYSHKSHRSATGRQ